MAAPHAKVVPAGGVDVGAPVGEPVGALVGALVPVAIEGGVVVDPPPAGSAPTDGVAGSVGLVVVAVEPPPMTLPSVEPPHATAARMPASENAQSAVRGSVVFIEEQAISSGARRPRVSTKSRAEPLFHRGSVMFDGSSSGRNKEETPPALRSRHA